MIEMLLGPLVLAAMIRLTTPILLVAIGGSFGHKASMLNIGLESFMLSSAFFSMLGSYLFSESWIGLAFGIGSGLIASILFGIFVLKLKTNPIITGIAFNLASWGFTTFLLDTLFNVRGVFVNSRIESFENINLPGKSLSPFLWKVLSGHNILVYLAFLLAIIAYFVMYKTPFGLRLRGVGIKEIAAQTVGIDAYRYKWIAIIISGFTAGIAGAYLSIGGASMFTENMSAGKGFLALAAIMVGEGNPIVVALICLAFGYTTALSVSLQALGIPSQMVLTFPYLFTILILIISYNLKRIRFKTKKIA
jgi:ABC-type uncharacterized transport system permease subunit